MAKRKARSQTSNLSPDHRKSRIDPIPLCVSGVRHVVGKLSTRATTLVETSFRLEVCTRSYSPAKLRDSHISGLPVGGPGTKNHSDATPEKWCIVY